MLGALNRFIVVCVDDNAQLPYFLHNTIYLNVQPDVTDWVERLRRSRVPGCGERGSGHHEQSEQGTSADYPAYRLGTKGGNRSPGEQGSSGGEGDAAAR